MRAHAPDELGRRPERLFEVAPRHPDERRIAAVGRDTDGLKSDYLLETDIRDFQARYDAADAPPTVVVRIAAKLIAVRGRTIAQSLTAHAEVAAGQNNVPSVVVAFNQALAQTLGQITAWALSAPMPPRVD